MQTGVPTERVREFSIVCVGGWGGFINVKISDIFPLQKALVSSIQTFIKIYVKYAWNSRQLGPPHKLPRDFPWFSVIFREFSVIFRDFPWFSVKFPWSFCEVSVKFLWSFLWRVLRDTNPKVKFNGCGVQLRYSSRFPRERSYLLYFTCSINRVFPALPYAPGGTSCEKHYIS